jgi:hypothetical protein
MRPKGDRYNAMIIKEIIASRISKKIAKKIFSRAEGFVEFYDV